MKDNIRRDKNKDFFLLQKVYKRQYSKRQKVYKRQYKRR